MESGSTKRFLILGVLAIAVICAVAYVLRGSSDEPTAANPVDTRPDDGDEGSEGSSSSDDARLAEAETAIDLPPGSVDQPVPPGTVVPPQEPPPGAEYIGVDAGPRSRAQGPETQRPVYMLQPNIRPSDPPRVEREYPQPSTDIRRVRPRDAEEDARNNARIEQVFSTRLEQMREQAAEARRTGDLRRAADLDDLVTRMEASQAAFERRRAGD